MRWKPLQERLAMRLLTGKGWLSLQRSERRGKSANVHKRYLVDYHLGDARAALRIGKSGGPAEAGR